jgi:hypothetical protein
MHALFSHSLRNKEELMSPSTEHMGKLEEAIIIDWLCENIRKLLLSQNVLELDIECSVQGCLNSAAKAMILNRNMFCARSEFQ